MEGMKNDCPEWSTPKVRVATGVSDAGGGALHFSLYIGLDGRLFPPNIRSPCLMAYAGQRSLSGRTRRALQQVALSEAVLYGTLKQSRRTYSLCGNGQAIHTKSSVQ